MLANDFYATHKVWIFRFPYQTLLIYSTLYPIFEAVARK